jgi:endogenous inhibitor of DNA gyrase (YacG/DUF329 family)
MSTKPTCPICGKPVDRRFRPFCSRRCADVDLGRWLTESYRVPVRPDENDAEGDFTG